MNFKSYLKEQMKDDNFKKEYDALEPEYKIIHSIMDARIKSNMTQKELAKRAKLTQADISRLESGNSNPTIKILQRIADGLNMNLDIRFVPKLTKI